MAWSTSLEFENINMTKKNQIKYSDDEDHQQMRTGDQENNEMTKFRELRRRKRRLMGVNIKNTLCDQNFLQKMPNILMYQKSRYSQRHS